MFDVLRFRAGATPAKVGAALLRTPARRVALVFPLGIRPALADHSALTAIHERACRAGKEVTLVGGDAHLRACAVAAGFAAATSLDGWRAAGESRTGRREQRRQARAPRPTLRLVDALVAETESTDAAAALEMPDYLRQLLDPEDAPAYDGHDGGEPAPIHSWMTAGEFAGVDLASARHEEEMSDAIRASSGLALTEGIVAWLPLTRWAAGDDARGEARLP